MTIFPAKDAMRNVANQGDMKDDLENMLAAAKELPGGSAESELTIASGSVTPTASTHSIDTEADASADDLTHIDQTNHPDGRIILIHSENASRVVTVKHDVAGNGKILLVDDLDLILDDPEDYLILQRVGTTWQELVRSHTKSQFCVQHHTESSVTFLSGSTNVPFDDTKPQSSEGDQIMSFSFTPKKASHELLLIGQFNASINPVGGEEIIISLYKDSDANPLTSVAEFGQQNKIKPIPLQYSFSPGSTSPITFKVRIGGPTGDWNINGVNGARKLGGTLQSVMTVLEFKA